MIAIEALNSLKFIGRFISKQHDYLFRRFQLCFVDVEALHRVHWTIEISQRCHTIYEQINFHVIYMVRTHRIQLTHGCLVRQMTLRFWNPPGRPMTDAACDWQIISSFFFYRLLFIENRNSLLSKICVWLFLNKMFSSFFGIWLTYSVRFHDTVTQCCNLSNNGVCMTFFLKKSQFSIIHWYNMSIINTFIRQIN